MKLTCPKCGHKWNYKGNKYRAMCMNCRRKHNTVTWIKTGLPPNATNSPPNATNSISDDIMRGNITEALNKADIDPFNSKGKLSKDFIPLLLKNDKLKFAFAEYCDDNKKQPLWVVKKAIMFFLEQDGYYAT